MAEQAVSASIDATVFETAGLALAVYARGGPDEVDLRPSVTEVLARVVTEEERPEELPPRSAAGFKALWLIANGALDAMPQLEDIESRSDEIRNRG